MLITQKKKCRKSPSEKTTKLFSTRDGLGEKTTEKSPSSHSNFVYSLISKIILFLHTEKLNFINKNT